MAYKLNKTDGTLLVDLIDGTLDTASTSISLIGRNYTGFGEALNENFVKILENFANTSSPSNPIEGQLWWDKSDARLKVYEGSIFKAVGGPFVQKEQPAMVAGDLWIDNVNDQIYFYDGVGDPVLAGPVYTKQQGVSGWVIESIRDTTDRARTIASLYIGDSNSGTTRVAVSSNVEFEPAVGYRIDGITGNVKKGINIIDKDNFIYEGTVDSAKSLLKSNGTKVTADSFLSTTGDQIVAGTITVQNSDGVTIGPNTDLEQKVIGDTFAMTQTVTDNDLRFRITSTLDGAQATDAIYIDATNKRVGIWNSTPAHTLDLTGDMRITGNLIVEGSSTSIDVSSMRVEDKNIELAITSDSTLLPEADVDDAGLIVRVTGTDKKFTWRQTPNAWTTTENLNVTSGNSYKVDGTNVLTGTTLGSGVVNSSLTNVGTLTALTVDNITIDGNTITNSLGGLTFDLAGDITFTNTNRISGLGVPGSPTDAATKQYVDEEIAGAGISFSMDSTGLNDTQIGLVLEDLVPAANVSDGTYARIHCTTLGGASVTGIDITAVATKSFIAVDSAGVQNESVMQDIGFTDATGTVTVSVSRALKRYVKSSGSWTFDQDLVSSV
tara:strand:- start:2092 stop:3915 length:1824 start_codon:yes stop_codon:yes gene_type:complete